MVQQLSQRDEANSKLLAHLSSLSNSFELERDQHRSQLALVMRLQRGSRRVLIILLFFSFLLISLLLALVLVMALRPDLIGKDSLTNPFAPAWTSSESVTPNLGELEPSIRDASQSENATIRESADALLEGGSL